MCTSSIHTCLCAKGFTIDSFRHMCILSGCDYLASVPGIGLGKALKLMKRFNKDPYRVGRNTCGFTVAMNTLNQQHLWFTN